MKIIDHTSSVSSARRTAVPFSYFLYSHLLFDDRMRHTIEILRGLVEHRQYLLMSVERFQSDEIACLLYSSTNPK